MEMFIIMLDCGTINGFKDSFGIYAILRCLYQQVKAIGRIAFKQTRLMVY